MSYSYLSLWLEMHVSDVSQTVWHSRLFALIVSLLFHHICPFCCETNDVQNSLIVCSLLAPYSYLIINILVLFINSSAYIIL